MSNKTDKSDKKDKPDKFKRLKTLESICTGAALVSFGGFLTGALYNNETLSLISGGSALLSTVAGLYASHRQTYLELSGYRPDADADADIKQDNSETNQSTNNSSSNHSYPNTDSYEVQ